MARGSADAFLEQSYGADSHKGQDLGVPKKVQGKQA